MRMLLAKFFTLLAFSILLSHDFIPHHHDLIETTDEHTNNNHNLFSFGQLDENFILAKSQTSITNNDFAYHLLFLSNPILSCVVIHSESDKEYSSHQEFPPPENYQLIASLRAPPVFVD